MKNKEIIIGKGLYNGQTEYLPARQIKYTKPSLENLLEKYSLEDVIHNIQKITTINGTIFINNGNDGFDLLSNSKKITLLYERFHKFLNVRIIKIAKIENNE